MGETQRTPRGRPAPQHPQPRREISRGACLGGETSPGSCHWKPLFLAARGGAAPPQLVLITLTGSRACCGGAPSPPQSRPGRQTSPHFPLPARLGCAWGGCADRDSTPPPPHSPACRGLSSSARLLMGTPGPSPPPWHCRSSFQHLETHPPCPLYYGTQTSWFLCVQIW